MINFLKSLRREPEDYRSVFAEFAIMLVFAVAEQMAAAKDRPPLRVVR
jgi:hypothetical protein